MSERAFPGPTVDSEEVLGIEKMIQFGQEIAWPALNEIAGYDFLNKSLPGDKYEIVRAIQPAGTRRLLLSARCFMHPDSVSKRPKKQRSLAIGIENALPELTQGAVVAARQDAFGVEALKGIMRKVRAWEGRVYRFGESPERPFYVAYEHFLQLGDANSVWGDRRLSKPKIDEDGFEVNDDEVTELDSVFESTATDEDCMLMRDIFIKLGVRQDKMDRNFR